MEIETWREIMSVCQIPIALLTKRWRSIDTGSMCGEGGAMERPKHNIWVYIVVDLIFTFQFSVHCKHWIKDHVWLTFYFWICAIHAWIGKVDALYWLVCYCICVCVWSYAWIHTKFSHHHTVHLLNLNLQWKTYWGYHEMWNPRWDHYIANSL